MSEHPILNCISHFEHPDNRLHVLFDNVNKTYYSNRGSTTDINNSTTFGMIVNKFTAAEVARKFADDLNSKENGVVWIIIPVNLSVS